MAAWGIEGMKSILGPAYWRPLHKAGIPNCSAFLWRRVRSISISWKGTVRKLPTPQCWMEKENTYPLSFLNHEPVVTWILFCSCFCLFGFVFPYSCSLPGSTNRNFNLKGSLVVTVPIFFGGKWKVISRLKIYNNW